MMRFADDTFMDSFITTIGVDFRYKTMNIDNKVIKLQIWDTAGQEKFKAITSSYYRNTDAVMIVFDVSDAKSFENIVSWLSEINEYCSTNPSKMIIGNKSDIDESKRDIDYETAKEYTDKLDIPYIETSAKTAENVEKAFQDLSKQLIEKKTIQQNNLQNAIDFNQNNSTQQPSSCAC